MGKRIRPDITVTEGEWTAKQTYAFSDIYVVEWIHNGRCRRSILGDYKTEKKLREELKQADEIIRRLDRDYDESLIGN